MSNVNPITIWDQHSPGQKLVCQRCGGTIGQWPGTWATLEIELSQWIGQVVNSHQCDARVRQTDLPSIEEVVEEKASELIQISDATREDLKRAKEYMKKVRKFNPDLSFSQQTELYINFLKDLLNS